MKNLNLYKFSTLLSLGVAVSMTLQSSAYAQSAATPTPSPSPSPSGPVVTLNPATLRSYVLNYNNSLIEGMNQVAISKKQIDVARANLLPSINVSGLINPSTFILSAVQFLLPFLLPSNWFNLAGSKRAFDAEKVSYQILQLNTYSSILSMYYTALADIQTRKIYEAEAKDYGKLYKTLQDAYNGGSVGPDDVRNAQSQYQLATAQASQWAGANITEVAAIRAALALPLGANLQLANVNMPASQFEGVDVEGAVTVADDIAPERVQLQYLIKAAKTQKWSTLFSFINSATLGSVSSNGAFSAFSKSVGVGAGFSFAIFPSIQITNLNIKMLNLEDTDITQANQRVLESTVLNINEAVNQVNLATQSSNLMNGIYKTRIDQYNNGIGSFDGIVLASTQLVQSELVEATAQMNLNNLRVVLHRAMITDQFSKIGGCRTDSSSPYGGFLKGVFGGKKAVSMDDVCKPTEEDDAASTATVVPVKVSDVVASEANTSDNNNNNDDDSSDN